MKLLLACALFVFSSSVFADVAFDGFVDAYYAYDFNGPPAFDRAYTTQPARSDEFNVNLVSIGATVARERLRGRLALQAGTSVQDNYAGEPTNGVVSGPSLSRNIQEAYVGTELAKDLWIDGGIYFSHVGGESFISKNNLTYTRSLVADFSPYYQAGVKLSYTPSKTWGFQLHVINGWQNISETNHSKMIGTQVAWAPSDRLNLTYNTLIGREAEFRHFHDFVLSWRPTDVFTVLLQADIGFQNREGGLSEWDGFTLVGKYQIAQAFALIARVEDYNDPDQVIVTTQSPHGFKTWSASLGLDETVTDNVTWRSEFRQFWTRDSIFPSRDGFNDKDALVVTSLSASF